MKNRKVIRLTESDLRRIVKRLLSEQGFTLLGTSNPVRPRFDLSKGGSTSSGKRLPTPEDGIDVIDPIIGGSSERDKEYMVKDLFNKLSKSPTYKIEPSKDGVYSKLSNLYYLIEYIYDLKNIMEGIGGNDRVLDIFSELDKKDLSTIINYWKVFTKSDKSLLEWLDGEWGISWDEIWDSIGDFKNEMGIELYKKYTELS
jgi:hypothetical protein